MKLIHLFVLFITICLLAGCGSTPTNPQAQTKTVLQINADKRAAYAKRIKQLYLRGTFTRWGYDEQFKLIKVGQYSYAAAAQLSKNKHYEFMFSAKDASRAYANCGYLQAKDQLMTLNKKVKASCTDVVLQNFTFSPTQSATYEFFIDFANIDIPRVYIQKAF